jgi:hypothetical protein
LEWSVGKRRELGALSVHAGEARRAERALSRIHLSSFAIDRASNPDQSRKRWAVTPSATTAAVSRAREIARAVVYAADVVAIGADRAMVVAEHVHRVRSGSPTAAVRDVARLREDCGPESLIRPIADRISRLDHSRQLLLRVGLELVGDPSPTAILSWAEGARSAADIAREIASQHKYADACWPEIRAALAVGDRVDRASDPLQPGGSEGMPARSGSATRSSGTTVPVDRSRRTGAHAD